MNKTQEALKLALEALTHLQPTALTSFYTIGDRDKAITAIREALAEQPAQQQEPVGKWMGDCIEWTENPYKLRKGQPIYTSPQPASKSVTDEQLYEDAFEQGVHEGSSKAMRECRDAYFQSMNVNLRKLNEAPQRKPLTDEQIMEMYNEPRSDAEMIEFARAIEAAHGIKGDA